MSLAEKYYRIFYKVKDGVKLSNEQWKVVKMMHECLREYNKPKLPQGAIMVNKQALVNHLRYVKNCLKDTDALMLNSKYKDFSNGEGGKEMAKIWNALNLTMQSILHFQLNVPLERLNEEIAEL
ncbi:MAG: hypothetical protein V4538_14920 [Bacteroidota bacterium]